MRNRSGEIAAVFRAAGLRFATEGAAFLAQALAFNTLFAAIPLSLVVVSMFGFFYGTDQANARALDAIDRFAPQLYDMVSSNIESVVRYRGISGSVGLLGLIWSGKNVFAAVAYGLDRSLGLPSRHFLVEILVALVLVPLLGIVLIVATALPVIISFVVQFFRIEYLRFGPQVASYAASVAFIFVVAWLVYTYLPNRRATLAFGIPGAVITSVGYSIAQVAFAVYTTHTNVLQIYGTLSAIFALMLWVYVVAAIFLYGAHFSAQWELRFDHGSAPAPLPPDEAPGAAPQSIAL